MPAEAEVDTLTRVLVRACRALADAGRAAQAGRLAGEAWAVLQAAHPSQARHLDGAMHYVARLHQQQEPLSGKEITMPVDPILDVRAEPPARRHGLILDTFARLEPGQAYVLVNDHDPKPLRYQFEAEQAGEFTWAYLEEGPEAWRVRIGRAGGTQTAGAHAWPQWRQAVVRPAEGPGVAMLHESGELKVVLVSLRPGQALPAHPGPAASFHILAGAGAVLVDDDEIPVSAGATVIAGPGTQRAVRADTALTFLGNLGAETEAP